MKKNHVTELIKSAFTEDLSELAVLTIRADGTIKNGACVRQSPWSQNATGSIHLLVHALDRTISHLSRGENKDMKFVAFFGGEKDSGVAGHFHALLQFPSNADKEAFVEKFQKLWSIKVSDALKTTLKTSVYAKPIKSQEAYSAYCSRYEGATFGGGSEKVVMSRSLKF